MSYYYFDKHFLYQLRSSCKQMNYFFSTNDHVRILELIVSAKMKKNIWFLFPTNIALPELYFDDYLKLPNRNDHVFIYYLYKI